MGDTDPKTKATITDLMNKCCGGSKIQLREAKLVGPVPNVNFVGYRGTDWHKQRSHP